MFDRRERGGIISSKQNQTWFPQAKEEWTDQDPGTAVTSGSQGNGPRSARGHGVVLKALGQ